MNLSILNKDNNNKSIREHLVSFLCLYDTTLLSWWHSRSPQGHRPSQCTSEQKGADSSQSLQVTLIPLPSLPTPSIVSSSTKSKHKNEATSFHTLMDHYLLVLSLDSTFCKQNVKVQKNTIICKLFSHSRRPLPSQNHYQI